MASVLAIVSKAVFEPIAGTARPGAGAIPFERYASTHKALETLADGGALFLVTVRPPDEALWLVGILDAPTRKKDGWYATNRSPIADITPLIGKLVFSTGKGLSAKQGALAMSLQTPRTLTDEDVALLRAAAGAAPATKSTAAKRTAAKPTAAKRTAAKRTAAKAAAAKPAAAKPAAAKPAAAKSTPAKADVFDLAAIGDALADGDAAGALEAALVAWRQTRATALADLIDAIASKIDCEVPETDAAWGALASGRDPATLGGLLAAVPELAASFLPTAGHALAEFPDDPRLAMAVATWAQDPPTTSSSTYPFWTKALDAMTRAADARVIPLVKKRLKQKQGDSQFWPKFYKALEKAVAKIETAPRAAVDDKAIGKLVKAANALERATAAPRVTATPKQAVPKLDGPPLAQAVTHLEAGRVQAGIEAMLVAWRDTERAPAIADALDRATRLLPAWDRALAASDKEAEAAWDAAFDADPQAAMPQLLEYLRTGGPRVAERHLVRLASLPADPRVALRLTQLSSRYEISPERTQYWKSLFELLAAIRDPRVAPVLCAVFKDFEGTYYDHHRQARRIISAWAMNPPTPPQLGPKETADLAAIDKALATLEGQRDGTEHALVSAIADAWNDPGPRLVYAEWLVERQHPRGELIVLACKDKPTAAETKRLAELRLKTTNLYGVLDELSAPYKDSLAVDRGLPTRIHVEWWTSPLAWRPLVGYPLLATIATIEIDDNARLPAPADLARVLLDPTARRLATVKGVPPDLWVKLKPLVDGKWKQKGTDLVRA